MSTALFRWVLALGFATAACRSTEPVAREPATAHGVEFASGEVAARESPEFGPWYPNPELSAPEEPSLRLGAIAAKGALNPDVILRVVRPERGRLLGCYKTALLTTAALAGSVTASFTIGPDGSPAGVSTQSTLGDENAANCIERVLANLTFPWPKAGVVRVTVPIEFSPGVVAAGLPAFEPTIAGVPLSDVTAHELERALRDSGFTDVASRALSDREVVTLTATRAARTFSLTYVSAKARVDALSDEERERIVGAGKVYSEFGIFLAVEGDSLVECQEVLDALIKPAG